MRSLAVGAYDAAAVEAVLRSDHHQFGSRFDVYDSAGSLIGELVEEVTKASIEWNGDRDMKGTLSLTMFANDLLGFEIYQRLIKPVFLLLMPDGGLAEFPLGAYVWHAAPDRDLGGGIPPIWRTQLADLNMWLDDGGPGPGGYSISSGTPVTDAIGQVHTLAGTTVFGSAITASAAVTDGPLTWDLTDRDGKLNTWRTILGQLHEQIGYYSPWFDGDGIPRATPVPDLSTAAASVTYRASSDSITLEPVTTGHDLNRRANRVFARAQSATGAYSFAVADADVLYPTHPWRHAAINRYIDALIDSSAGADLQAAANAELAQRLTSYQTVAVRSLAWPVHEMFDIVAVQWDDDDDLDEAQRYHERRWTLDLITGEMAHDLRRIA